MKCGLYYLKKDKDLLSLKQIFETFIMYVKIQKEC